MGLKLLKGSSSKVCPKFTQNDNFFNLLLIEGKLK